MTSLSLLVGMISQILVNNLNTSQESIKVAHAREEIIVVRGHESCVHPFYLHCNVLMSSGNIADAPLSIE